MIVSLLDCTLFKTIWQPPHSVFCSSRQIMFELIHFYLLGASFIFELKNVAPAGQPKIYETKTSVFYYFFLRVSHKNINCYLHLYLDFILSLCSLFTLSLTQSLSPSRYLILSLCLCASLSLSLSLSLSHILSYFSFSFSSI